jgi:acyl carrier protein
MTRPAVPPASREAFAAAICDFINDELPRLSTKAKEHPRVAPDTPLFATGIVDSMAILHLIAFIERSIGCNIPPDKVVMKHFFSADIIADSFWTPPAAP